MGQVIGQILGSENDVRCMLSVGRHADASQVGQCTCTGHRLRHRTDSANARHIDQGIVRLLAQQDLLEAAVHRGVDARTADAPVVNIEADF